MGAFNAGSIESTLTLDRTPFQAGLDAAKAEAEEFERGRHEAKLGADLAELQARLDEANAKMDEFADKRPTAELDADAVAADEKIDATTAKVDELGDKTATVRVEADTAGADEKIEATSVAAHMLGTTDPEIVAMFQDADAITQMGAFKAYVDEQFPEGELRDLTIMANIQQAMLNVDRLETRLAELKAQPYDVKVDAQIDDLEAKVNAARLALLTLIDKNIVIGVTDDGGFARIATENDALEAKLNKLAAERPTVVITADDAAFNEKVTAAAENVKRIPDLKETVLLAQVASAVSNVETLQARLDVLTSKPAEVRVVGEIEDLQAKLDLAKLKLAELVDKHIKIDVDDGGSFARVKTEAELAAEAAAKVGDSAETGMSQLQTYAAIGAAALPPVSAGILAIPAALALVAVPAAAVALGMDGIKASASGLAPEFDAVKASASAAFETGLQPAIQNVQTLLPVLGTDLAGTATALSTVATGVTGVVSSSAGMAQVNSVFSGVNTIITNMSPGITGLTQNMLSLAQTGISGLQPLAGVVNQLSEAWKSTLADLSASGTSTAAIQALVQVLGAVGALIPPLVSEGAQLMAVLGPPLAGALNVVAAILGALAGPLGDVTTAVLAGVAAWKLLGLAVDGIGTGFNKAVTALSNIGTAQRAASAAATEGAAATEIAEGSTTKFAGALSKVGSAIPLVGAALIAGSEAYKAFHVDADATATALLSGGAAATKASATFDGLSTATGNTNVLYGIFHTTQADVTASMNQQIAAMTPLQAAQARVNLAQTAWNNAVKEFGPDSSEAAFAAADLASKTQALAAAQTTAAAAAQTLTDAIAQQTAQFESAVGAEISYEQSLLKASDAATKTAAAVKAHGAASTEAKTAILAEESAINGAAAAAQKKAEADTAALGPEAQAKAGADAYNTSLLSLASQASPQAQAALLKLTAGMTDTQLQAVTAAAQVSGLATKVLTLPDGRTVTIIADPSQANTSIDQLNMKAKQPLGPASITANAAPALGTFQQFMGSIAAARPIATVNGNVTPFSNAFVGARNTVQGTTTTAPIAGSPAQMLSAYTGARGTVQGTPAVAPINGNAAPFTATANAARTSAQAPATMPINGNPAPANGVLSSLVGQINGTTGTAHVNAEPAPATGVLAAFLAAMNGTTGISHVNAEPAGANSVLAAWLTAVNGTTGTGHVAANDAAARGTLASLLAAINGSSATVTIRANRVGFAGGGIAPVGFAGGGVHHYAEGGVEDTAKNLGMSPMAANTAAIVPPNTLRVIGDRAKDDEFYIPDNNDGYSMALAGEFARRRGMQMVPMADGGLVATADAMTNQIAAVTIQAQAQISGGGSPAAGAAGAGITQAQAAQMIQLLGQVVQGLGRARGVTNNTNVYNPLAETGSDAINLQMRKLSALGLFA